MSCPQEYMDSVIVEAFSFGEEEARAAEMAAPAAAALPTEVVRSKVSCTLGLRVWLQQQQQQQ